MRITWVVGLAILWLLGTLISLTLEETYIGQEAQYDMNGNQVGTMSTLDQLMSPSFSEMTNPVSFVIGVFNVVWDYLKVFWNMFWWNYSFFTGVWTIFQYVGRCISLGVIVAFVLALRGTPSG